MLHLLYVYAYYHTRNKRTSMRLYCCELSARENRHKISYTHTHAGLRVMLRVILILAVRTYTIYCVFVFYY